MLSTGSLLESAYSQCSMSRQQHRCSRYVLVQHCFGHNYLNASSEGGLEIAYSYEKKGWNRPFVRCRSLVSSENPISEYARKV